MAATAHMIGLFMKNFATTYGPWALVTGASSGIGREFARQLASDGVHLVIAARRKDRLDELAEELSSRHGVDVRAVRADLSTDDGIDAIEKAVADVDLAIVINNAGAAHPGAFLNSTTEDQLQVIRLNVTTPAQLAHRLGERLVGRGRGAMIFVGSTSAFAGVPMLANYAATKAFIGTLAEGLHAEWKPKGVDAMVVHPGPTRTEMVEMDGVDFDAVPTTWMTAEQVASAALNAVGKRALLVPGAPNKMQRFVFTRLLPRRTASRVWGALMGRATDDALR